MEPCKKVVVKFIQNHVLGSVLCLLFKKATFVDLRATFVDQSSKNDSKNRFFKNVHIKVYDVIFYELFENSTFVDR